MCPYLNRYGIKDFALAGLDEALELRRNGIIGNIIIPGYVYHKVKIYDLTVSITSYEHARILNDRKIGIKCHLQIDTMMKRLGIDYKETEYIKEVFKLKYLKITGVYSHLCDVKDKDFTVKQLKSYDKVVDMLKINGYGFKTHIQAAEALFRFPEYKYDYVRIGIGLYGYGDKSLKPVMSVRSRIIGIKMLKKGETLGYEQSFKAHKDMKAADVSIGYGDGISRVQDKPYALCKGNKCAVIGRICMDQLFIDDEVIIPGEGIDIDTLSENCNNIPNKTFAAFKRRITKKAVNY